MTILEWLNNNAARRPSDIEGDDGDIWVTKDRGDYITRAGMEHKVRFLADYTLSKVSSTWGSGKPINIGFSEKEQKWYGWSHRAIYGFGIGSKVSRGDCAYVGATPEDLIEDRARFFAELGEEKANIARAECQILPDRSGITILHAPMVLPMVSMENLAAAINGDDVPTEQIDIRKDSWSVKKCGRGEWAAKTLEDAKQMAVDFAEGVA